MVLKIRTIDFAKWGTFIGGIATAVALVFLILQTVTMMEDFDHTHRPWIGVEDVSITKADEVRFIVKNYGTLPNTNSKIMISWGKEPLTRDFLIKNGKFLEGNVIMPGSDFSIIPDIPPQIIQAARNGGSLYLGIIIYYEYGNEKKKEYGAILQYHEGDRFFFIHTWPEK